MMSLQREFLRQCRRQRRMPKVADSTGNKLTGGQLLLKTLVARRLLRRNVLGESEQHVGVLLPPSVGAIVVNMALAVDRRIAVNLNYTVSSAVMNACIRQANIRHVLTSRRFLEKMPFELDAEFVYLEDFKDQVTLGDKLAAAYGAFVQPIGWLERSLGLEQVQDDDVLTVIFTSGSTGEPKGVMLTQRNIRSNVEAIEEAVRFTSDDVVVGILPFFHSFGYTTTLWTVATIAGFGAFHFSPLDAKQVGKLCREHKGTILLSTPTFLRTYLRRCEPEELKTLDVVVAGAEKLPKDLCDAFEEKFGVRPIEGYGATELSPLVSVNIPASRLPPENGHHVLCKEGTVGRCIPGVEAQVRNLDTGANQPPGEAGMLWIRGPNVMKGYLGRPDLTAEVVRNGWYCTGDIAFLDKDGFITITGRESRFSKIGGEMVPHIQIEETLQRVIGAGEEEGLKAAVTAIPDAKRGERLIVIHTALKQSPNELCQALAAAGLPNLFIPSPDSFHLVAELPILGSGKLDLKAVKQMAVKAFAGT